MSPQRIGRVVVALVFAFAINLSLAQSPPAAGSSAHGNDQTAGQAGYTLQANSRVVLTDVIGFLTNWVYV